MQYVIFHLTHHSEHGRGDKVLFDEVAEKEGEYGGHDDEEVEEVPGVLEVVLAYNKYFISIIMAQSKYNKYNGVQ